MRDSRKYFLEGRGNRGHFHATYVRLSNTRGLPAGMHLITTYYLSATAMVATIHTVMHTRVQHIYPGKCDLVSYRGRKE